MQNDLNRRRFLQTSAGLAAAGIAAGGALPAFARIGVHNGAGKIKVGVIGCGGRGTGAADDILSASPDTVIVALGDMFEDRGQERPREPFQAEQRQGGASAGGGR